jgi:ribonucleoside-diphosphate reductase alpha chain
MFSFFNGTDLGNIDYSKLRKKGDLIAGRFIHSGKEPLETAANKVIEFLHTKAGKKLKPIDVSDIICWFAQAVVSAGTRRSACIAIFSWDDKDMLNAKTGDWFSTNPQRAMANISALMVRNKVKQEDVNYVVEMSKQFGEPGLVFADNEDYVGNPCMEVGMNPKTIDGQSGFQFCNLVEINMSKCKDKHEFYAACLAASTTATIQASFNKFPYLGKTTEQIMQGAALIGVSLTGYYDAGFEVTPEILETGAWMVKHQNFEIAYRLGIMPARRCTTIKPSGNASILLETEPSINAAHSERYLRHVRLSKSQDLYKFIKQNYPKMIVAEDAPFSNGYDCVVGFPITTKPTTRLKREETAMSQINTITEVFEHWILAGDRKLENTTHNVSNTIVVKDDEWEDVKKKIFSVRNKVGGVTFLSDSGDKTYPYCPYTSVISDKEYEDLANIDRDNYNYYTEIFRDCINKGWEFLDMIVTLEDDVQARWKEFYYHDLFEMIENEYDNIDFSNIVINDKEEIGATAAVACSGGQCTIV